MEATMPAESKSQRRLMGAAEHGANFPAAKKVRESMTHEQMHDFASTKEKDLPEHMPDGKHKGFGILIKMIH
jgi:hypothetical protein